MKIEGKKQILELIKFRKKLEITSKTSLFSLLYLRIHTTYKQQKNGKSVSSLVFWGTIWMFELIYAYVEIFKKLNFYYTCLNIKLTKEIFSN